MAPPFFSFLFSFFVYTNTAVIFISPTFSKLVLELILLKVCCLWDGFSLQHLGKLAMAAKLVNILKHFWKQLRRTCRPHWVWITSRERLWLKGLQVWVSPSTLVRLTVISVKSQTAAKTSRDNLFSHTATTADSCQQKLSSAWSWVTGRVHIPTINTCCLMAKRELQTFSNDQWEREKEKTPAGRYIPDSWGIC